MNRLVEKYRRLLGKSDLFTNLVSEVWEKN